jgi:hypothetical protein
MSTMIRCAVSGLIAASAFIASHASAQVVYCTAEGVPAGCVARAVDRGAPGVGVLPGPGAGAPGPGAALVPLAEVLHPALEHRGLVHQALVHRALVHLGSVHRGLVLRARVGLAKVLTVAAPRIGLVRDNISACC